MFKLSAIPKFPLWPPGSVAEPPAGSGRLRGLLACLLLLGLAFSAPFASAQEPLIIQGKTLTVVQEMPFSIKAPSSTGLYFWTVPAGVGVIDKGESLEVISAPKGSLTINVKIVIADLDKDGRFKGFIQKFGSVTFAVGDVPKPPEPEPPGPGPTPPVPPVPPDPPSPIPAEGLRVLFVYESADLAKYPTNVQLVLYSQKVRSYLNAKCAKDADGKTPAYRVWDKDVDAGGESKLWKDALDRAKTKANIMPWVIISNGKTGYEGPVPAGVDEALKLLAKYGG